MSVNAERIAALTEALIDNDSPTPDQTRRAMQLAYEAGAIDGRLELLNEQLAGMTMRSERIKA